MYGSNLYVKDLSKKLANIATVSTETNVRCGCPLLGYEAWFSVTGCYTSVCTVEWTRINLLHKQSQMLKVSKRRRRYEKDESNCRF